MNGRIIWRENIPVDDYYSVSPMGQFIMTIRLVDGDVKAFVYEIKFIAKEEDQTKAYNEYIEKI